MKIYIAVDMEGISGVAGSEFVIANGQRYQEGRRYYTGDINACAAGCFRAGADTVIVRDAHSNGTHALWDQLDPRIELVQGTGARKRFPGLDECDGLILLGYHAMAGTPEALLEHTFSSASIQNIWLNERPVGEIGIDASIAAAMGIPTIMVSGDDKACHEATEWIPGVITCQVKIGYSCQCTRLLSLEKAHQRLEDKAFTAVRAIKSFVPPHVETPVTLRKEMMERIAIPHESVRPNIRVIDGRTYETTADSVESAFDLLS